MVSLLNTLVEADNRSFSTCVNMVCISEAVVVIVMTSTGNQQRDHVQVVQLANLDQSTLSHDHE